MYFSFLAPITNLLRCAENCLRVLLAWIGSGIEFHILILRYWKLDCAHLVRVLGNWKSNGFRLLRPWGSLRNNGLRVLLKVVFCMMCLYRYSLVYNMFLSLTFNQFSTSNLQNTSLRLGILSYNTLPII